MKDKTIDPFFTCPNSATDIMEYYGIESSRLFFIREYTSNSEIQKMNPVNIELLVDFQTAMGQILNITSTDIAKHGKSALVAASFEQPLEAFKKSSSVGSKDNDLIVMEKIDGDLYDFDFKTKKNPLKIYSELVKFTVSGSLCALKKRKI